MTLRKGSKVPVPNLKGEEEDISREQSIHKKDQNLCWSS